MILPGPGPRESRAAGIAGLAVLLLAIFWWSSTCLVAAERIRERDAGSRIIAVVGNWQGKLASVAADGRPRPALAWRVSQHVQALRRTRGAEVLVVGVGNEASPFAAASFLGRGELETVLHAACAPALEAVGPEDLAVLPFAALRRRVATNFRTPGGEATFTAHHRFSFGGEQWAFGCLISPALTQDLPLESWGGTVCEDPARAWRRMQVECQGVDRYLLVCHLLPDDLARIRRQAAPGTLFLQVPPAEETRSVTVGEAARSSGAAFPAMGGQDVFSVPGDGVATLILRQASPGGAWTARRLSCGGEEGRPPRLSASASAAFSRLRRDSGVPLRSLTFGRMDSPDESSREGPPPGFRDPFRLRPSAHARLARIVMRSDLALIGAESPGSWLGEPRLTPAVICTAFPNRRLRGWSLTGGEVRTLFFRLGRGNFPLRIGLAGADVEWLGGAPRVIRFRGRPLDGNGRYQVVLDGHLAEDPLLGAWLDSRPRIGPRGKTLWQAWLEGLPEMNDERELVEQDAGDLRHR